MIGSSTTHARVKPLFTVVAPMAAVQIEGEADTLASKRGRKALQLLGKGNEGFFLLLLVVVALGSLVVALGSLVALIAPLV